MTVKEFLSLVQDKEEAILEKQEYIERLRGSLGIVGIDYSKDRVQSGGGSDRFADVFAKIGQAETDLEGMQKDFITFKVEVMDMIEKVPEKTHRKVLKHVYLDYMSLKRCAVVMNFSYDYLRELHLEALRSFEEKFPHQFC